MHMIATLRNIAERAGRVRLIGDTRGLALTEFALGLPVLTLVSFTGLEYANYITTKMRVSQIALQIADNASRMGDQVNDSKVVSEANVNETFVGGNLQSGMLNLQANGRVILSSLEPRVSPNTTPPKYVIRWQRCYGAKVHASSYGLQGPAQLDGMGPPGRQITAQDHNATMFVEVFYYYTPLISARLAPEPVMREIASMAVRDSRALGGVPTAGSTPVATC